LNKKVKSRNKKETSVYKRTIEPPKPRKKSLKREWGIRFSLFLGLIIVITYLFPKGKSYQYADYKVGSVVDKEIIAPDDFPILKTPEELENERKKALEKVKPVFYRDEKVQKNVISKINKLFGDINNIAKKETEIVDLKSKIDPQKPDSVLQKKIALAQNDFDSLCEEFTKNYHLEPDNKRWDFIIQSTDLYKKKFKGELVRILNDLYSIGILNVSKSDFTDNNKKIIVKSNGKEKEELPEKFYDIESAKEEISNRLRKIYGTKGDTVNVAYEVINSFLQPDIIYNKEETQKVKDETIRKIPVTSGFVLKNQRIIDAHEVVTKDVYKKLQSLVAHTAEKNIKKGGIRIILPFLGKGLYLSLILLLLFSYLFIYKKEIFYDNSKFSLVVLIFLLTGLFFYILTTRMNLSEFLVPVTISSMLFAIIFDGITAFYGTVAIAFIASGFMGNEFSIVIITIITGTVAIYSVLKVRNRIQIFKASLFIALSYFILMFIMGTLQYANMGTVFENFYKYALPNSIFSPMLTLGLLAGIESIFKVTSDMTLLELSDLNRPLLKMLSMKAPGTYHHSIIMGTLAERAAESIDANSLLARVGAYYHDIGKMEKPDYFIENLMGRKNKHENLTPSMSCLIIISHVKDGLEIAKKYKLPKVIKDFIPMHHGTSLITYFYEKAKEKTGEKYINEADFRYPGPKPQTKETGIVMLADSVEAATKSLKEPSASRIREMVKSIVESKFKEGELDECALTLKDLNKISESFIAVLTSMFHTRIEYPGQEKAAAQKSEQKILEKL